MLQGDTKNDTKYDTRILTANFMDLSKIQKLYTYDNFDIKEFLRKKVLFLNEFLIASTSKGLEMTI